MVNEGVSESQNLESLTWKTVDEANEYLLNYFANRYHPVRLDNKTTRH